MYHDANSFGTPGTNDVPSLCLSNSSVSDGQLSSPYYETAPMQTSMSSVRTVQSTPHASESRRMEAMRRTAAIVRLPFEQVFQTIQLYERDLAAQNDQDRPDVDQESIKPIVDAFRSEEERLAQFASFRSAYIQAESSSSEFTPRLSLRSHRPHAIVPSRTMPPLSPPPSYESLEAGNVVPSPRAALNSLTSSQDPRLYPQMTHSRRPSGSRPLSLPDRSYHSMDDYTSLDSSSLQSQAASSSHLRRSVQGLASVHSQAPFFRTQLRSPLVDAPYVAEPEEINEPSSSTLSTRPLPPHKPVPSRSVGPTRKRSGSTAHQRPTSRRASTDVLGLGIPRSASPASMSDVPKISHEEVMARLQRKVKERIAARSSSGHSIPGESSPSSPSIGASSLHSNGRLDRRRQGSANGLPTTSSHRSSSKGPRRPRKAASLRVFSPQSDEKPLPELPQPHVDASVHHVDDDEKMVDVEHEPDASNRLGIEALLSAAAIADSPRAA